MKKLKALALVAIFTTAMLNPQPAEAKEEIKYKVNEETGCMETIKYNSILWGLITWGDQVIETVCPDGPPSTGTNVDLHQINFDNLINI